MATLSNQQIEQLKQQLKEKQEEIKAIELPDDFLDGVAGGGGGGGRPTPWQ